MDPGGIFAGVGVVRGRSFFLEGVEGKGKYNVLWLYYMELITSLLIVYTDKYKYHLQFLTQSISVSGYIFSTLLLVYIFSYRQVYTQDQNGDKRK